ncbi:MAG: hypothetical protein EBZ77_08220, partial [Chitinophagia bacterium]|nr:hypothetical protein [Chitinophagia bacterium]
KEKEKKRKKKKKRKKAPEKKNQNEKEMVVRVVRITQTDRGLKLGEGIAGFEEAMSRYALEAIRAGILGVHAARPIERGVVVKAPVARVSRTGNARIVRDATGRRRVVTTRAVDRGEEITVIGERDDYDDDDEETYERARRDVRRGIEYTRRAEAVSGGPNGPNGPNGPKGRSGRARQEDNSSNKQFYQSMLGERYIHRALRLLQKKPERV